MIRVLVLVALAGLFIRVAVPTKKTDCTKYPVTNRAHHRHCSTRSTTSRSREHQGEGAIPIMRSLLIGGTSYDKCRIAVCGTAAGTHTLIRGRLATAALRRIIFYRRPVTIWYRSRPNHPRPGTASGPDGAPIVQNNKVMSGPPPPTTTIFLLSRVE